MKNLFKEAHKITREIASKYDVDYQMQFGLCLSYLLQKGDVEMTMEKWFEGLDEKQKSKINDITDNYMLGRTADQKQKYFEMAKEQMYKKYLKEIEEQKEKEESAKEIKERESKQYEKDLNKGIATLELYESNRFRCWTAEIKGTDSKFEFDRDFINPDKIKGNDKYYELEEGKVYEYLNHNKRTFVKVENSKMIELTEEEVEELVK